MKIASTHIIAGIVVLLLGGAVLVSLAGRGSTPSNFDECAAAGNPVMESYPRQCRANGRTFVEDVSQPAPEPQPLPPEESREGRISGGCAVGGCSAQVCADAATAADIITTCEYRPEYACYQSARCERQANGECGWTETAELTACLRNATP